MDISGERPKQYRLVAGEDRELSVTGAQGHSLPVLLSWVSGSWVAIPDRVTHWLLESVFPVGGDAGFAAAGGITAVTAPSLRHTHTDPITIPPGPSLRSPIVRQGGEPRAGAEVWSENVFGLKTGELGSAICGVALARLLNFPKPQFSHL